MAAARVLIIANPAAAAVAPGLVWHLVRLCRRQVTRVSVRWTGSPGDATRIATKVAESEGGVPLAERALTPFSAALPALPATTPGTLVVAVGGDGTVRETAAGLASAWRGASPTPLTIVPAGTGNRCYHTLFGDTPWQEVVTSALAASSVRWLDLARIAGRLVFAGATAHFAGAPGRVTVDGREVHCGPMDQVSVAGGRHRGDGLLDVRLSGGPTTRGRRVHLRRTDGHPLHCTHDGDVLPPAAGYTVDVVPAAVPVFTTFALAA